MDTKTGGPAFPCENIVERNEKGHLHGEMISSAGLTVRDYFAAAALPGLISGRDWSKEARDQLPKIWANASYLVADAMLEARAK
jgi:hypothetical protein